MAILEAVVTQSFHNQTIINRYNYVASGTPAAVTLSYGLLYAMGYLASRLGSGLFPNDTLAGQVQGAQTSDVATIAAFARVYWDVEDFYESAFPTPPAGQSGSASMSPAMAYGFYASRVRTDIRRGQKRYVGVTETGVDAGGVINSSMMPSLVNVAAQLGDTLTYDDEGNTLTYVPCILGLVEYETPRGNRAYKRYATEALQLEHIAQGMLWTPYPNVRTQVSRQYGRGV